MSIFHSHIIKELNVQIILFIKNESKNVLWKPKFELAVFLWTDTTFDHILGYVPEIYIK